MKYGWRNNKLVAEEVTADVTGEVTASALDVSNITAVGTAASGTAAYLPVTYDGTTYYIEMKTA